jgi:hypothetical protein
MDKLVQDFFEHCNNNPNEYRAFQTLSPTKATVTYTYPTYDPLHITIDLRDSYMNLTIDCSKPNILNFINILRHCQKTYKTNTMDAQKLKNIVKHAIKEKETLILNNNPIVLTAKDWQN